MKKTTALLLAALLALALVPVHAGSAFGTRLVSNGTVIDTDGSDGYSGDYVVICNPSTDASSSMSTGNMAGLIETGVGEAKAVSGISADVPYRIDADAELMELTKAQGLEKLPAEEEEPTRTSYNVGDTHTFMIMNYSPDGLFMEFKVLAKSEHCYVWTPTSTAANVYPLDSIDPDYAQMAAEMFDSKFDLMQSSFGDHSNGSSGDGRLNLLYYNIDDGWQPGQGYIGGYFYALDLYTAGMPVLNIDTYPGVYYVNSAGEEVSNIANTYNVIVHEYQHLINYSQCGAADTWINECMSAAAEEICFPGSSVCSRIQSWINHFYSENDDWAYPPAEVGYVPGNSLHNGYSLYDWSNDLPMDDLLTLYAQVSLFAQYMYTRFGNAVYRSLIEHMSNGGGLSAANSFQSVCQAATGVDPAELARDFRIALTANTTPSEYDGLYSFSMQPGYDPAEYHDVSNLYDLLCPVVFTGSSCQIKGGGAITVKPAGGVYNPPAGAASGLIYIGVTRSSEPLPAILGDVDHSGAVAPNDALLVLRRVMSLIPDSALDMALADMNGDGAVTMEDALMILRRAMALI